MRDLKGYGRTPPDPKWPGGARVAVSFVINFEEGAEMSLSSGDPHNEKVYEVTDEVVDVPDRCMESHFEYGTKAAWWRIADVLERLGVPATVSTCGLAAQLSPWLIEEGGFLYDSDDYSDDLPFFVDVDGTRHVVVPYSFDTNDMHYHQGFHRFVTARDFAEYTTDAFDTLWAEGEHTPKMMSIGLHLRMIGRPGRIAALDRIVGHMRQKGDVWFATRRQIAEHWSARF